MGSQLDLKALELLRDSPELSSLEEEFHHFNPFLALRLEHYEIRHSAFLRWLLDPSESHDQKDKWLVLLLNAALKKCSNRMDNGLNEDCFTEGDLLGAEVLAEWHKTDILIKDDIGKRICVIENKVHGTEGEGQLARYQNIIDNSFPDYERAFLYLTPWGEMPRDPELRYHPFSYDELLRLIEDGLRSFSVNSSAAKEFIVHYITMVRRSVLNESKLYEVSGEIISDHGEAIGHLVRYRKEKRKHIGHLIMECIDAMEEYGPLNHTDLKIHFLPGFMDISKQLVEDAGDDSVQVLFWEIQNSFRHSATVDVKLFLSPEASEVTRTDVFRAIKSEEGKKVFHLSDKVLGKWTTLHQERPWILPGGYYKLDDDTIRDLITEGMEQLMIRARQMSDVFRKSLEL